MRIVYVQTYVDVYTCYIYMLCMCVYIYICVCYVLMLCLYVVYM